MCGIFVCLHEQVQEGCGKLNALTFTTLCDDLRRYNSYRGPDYQQNIVVKLKEESFHTRANGDIFKATGGLIGNFYASELRLRGDAPVQQPHQSNGNILCWNGEIFDGLKIDPGENDGVGLMEKLSLLETPMQIRDLLGQIEGPYALAYYHSATQRLFFARDPLGRRSLLIHKPSVDLPCLLLSSVSSGSSTYLEFEEVPTDFIYCIELSRLVATECWTNFNDSIFEINRQPSEALSGLPFAHPCKVNDSLPPRDVPMLSSLDVIPDHLVDPVDRFLEILDRSVALRVKNIPQNSAASPGSARLSVLFSGGIDSTVITYLANRHVPLDEPIDLLNVAFENPRKIRIAHGGNLGGSPKKHKKKGWQALQNTPLEVKASYTVPDRKTGLQELEELRRLCPGRQWNFVEINVPYEESQNAKGFLQTLMIPSRTVMDLSLAFALYFASRGRGGVREEPCSSSPLNPYTSPAKVVLSGLGSDELLGGYGRHRTAYNTSGWQGVIEELQLEIDRIPKRNLGRDDRIVSTHGKETRHPFLSLDVVSFLAQLPVQLKLDPRMEIGKGDKTLLRLVSRKLGLVEASNRKKRAMQFGSHSARMDGERRGDVDLA